MLKFSVLILCLALSCGLTAQEEQEEEIPAETPVNKEKEREDHVAAVVQGNNLFALQLYSKLKTAPGNFFFSPYTISAGMVLPYAGAKGGTQQQIQAGMHYLLQEQNLYETFAWLNRHLTSSWYLGPNENRLLLTSSLWYQSTIKILPDFLALVATHFKGSFRAVDFQRNPVGAVMTINRWIKDSTQGRVNPIVDREMTHSTTRMMMVSAGSIRGVWTYPFDPLVSKYQSFFVNDSLTLSVPMMSLMGDFQMLEQPQFTLLELPYRPSSPVTAEHSMVVFLPKYPFDISQVERLVISDALNGLLKNTRLERVIVTLPRFTISHTIDLTGIMQSMGMVLPFSSVADFSGISSNKDLHLNRVVHKAFLSVDEKGSEAVAATAFSLGGHVIAQDESPPLIFKVDHPFIFVIIEKSTRSLVFMGRIITPTET
jgi:serpin B